MKSCVTMHAHLSTVTTNTWQENREPASMFLFYLPPQCSTALTGRHTLPFLSFSFCLSGRVNRCWVITSTHHILTYFSNLSLFSSAAWVTAVRAKPALPCTTLGTYLSKLIGFIIVYGMNSVLPDISALPSTDKLLLLRLTWWNVQGACWPYIWSFRRQMNAMIDQNQNLEDGWVMQLCQW